MTSEVGTCENTCRTAADIESVVTSFNQGALILEAVQSLCAQTVLPGKIIVVDDGSTDEASIRILKELECGWKSPVLVEVYIRKIAARQRISCGARRLSAAAVTMRTCVRALRTGTSF